MENLEIEQCVIGGLLLNYTAFDSIADVVRESDFSKPSHRLAFKAIVNLIGAGQSADIITVCDYLENHGDLEKAGGMAYLGTLANNTPSTANIGAYAKILRDKALERDLLIAARSIADLVHGEGDTRMKLDKAQSLVGELALDQQSAGPVMAGSLLVKVFDGMEKRMQVGGGLLGISSGFTDLDKITSGLSASDLIILAGRPAMGKTSFAMNIAENVAIKQGGTALVFSMEMSAEQLVQRSMSTLAKVSLQKVRSADLDAEEWTKIASASGKIKDARLMIDDSPALTVLELRARARRVHRDRPLSLIVVDYLQLMSGIGENRNIVISEISRGLKALAKELDIPIIALSQLNRELERRQNKRPTMSDLRDSGAIEQDADIIAFVYRDEVYDEYSEAKGTAEIIVGKQRNGPPGTIRLVFTGEYCRFDNYAGPAINNVIKPHAKRWTGGMND